MKKQKMSPKEMETLKKTELAIEDIETVFARHFLSPLDGATSAGARLFAVTYCGILLENFRDQVIVETLSHYQTQEERERVLDQLETVMNDANKHYEDTVCRVRKMMKSTKDANKGAGVIQ